MNGAIETGPPERLSAQHDLSGFDSGEPALDDWLRRRAERNEASGASRTYVVCAGRKVAGYYALAAGAICHLDAPGRIKRNMPDPIPVMLVGRLAVDKAFHGQGVGAGLLRDVSEEAKRFYEKYGFVASPVDPLTVMITMAEAARIITRTP
jgi:GNAT superfamily N-acetyltransferase